MEPAAHDAPATPDDVEVTITVCPAGPLLLRGPALLLDGDGRPIDPGRRTVALCRCGRSARAPFCDGTHKRRTRRPSADEEERG